MNAILNIVIDVVLALIIIAFAVHGARKGFVMTLAGFVTIIIAMLGSMVVAFLFAPTVAGWLSPMVTEKLVPFIGEAGEAFGLQDLVVLGVRLGDLPQLMTLDTHVTAELIAPIADALSLSIARCVVSTGAFIVILLVLKIISHAVDMVARLPVLGTLNGLLGCVMGIVTGLLLCLLIVTVLSLFTGLIPPEVADKTIIFRFIRDFNLLTFIPKGGAQS